MNKIRTKISFNSPVILWFSIICIIVLLADTVSGGYTNNLLFSVYRSSIFDPFTYVRFIGHIFGHGSWNHFLANITLILVVGPMMEEKYGTGNIIFVMITTAIVTGVVNFVFFPNIQLLGASGFVFSLILLSSFTSIREGSIPLTFILVLVVYIGGQIYEGIFAQDNVSNLTHIIGGVVGAILGFVMNKNKMNRY